MRVVRRLTYADIEAMRSGAPSEVVVESDRVWMVCHTI